MINRLFVLLLTRVVAERSPDFIIGGQNAPHLRRWWVIPRNRWFNIYLHQFLRSDDHRVLHDHPWFNFSLILAGEYVEHTIRAGGVTRKVRRTAGRIHFRAPWTAHRVEIDQPCWSLFVTGPVQREWGFHCPNGWRPWRQFVDGRDAGAVGRGCE